MTAHLEVSADKSALTHWETLGSSLAQIEGVTGWSPQVGGQALLTRQNAVQGARIRGVLPEHEATVSVLSSVMREGTLSALAAGEFRVILGAGLADALGLEVGDDVMLVLAEPVRTATGMLPRMKRFVVAGIFEAGVLEFDTATAYIHLADAQRVFRRQTRADAITLAVVDPFDLRDVMAQLPSRWGKETLEAVPWTARHNNLFRALETEKIVMFVILLLAVGVAAFNLVSTLVMVVTEKAAEIAILRTLGMTPQRILRVFLTQGVLIGLAGVVLGGALGILLATHVETLIAWLERTLGFRVLAPDVYYISHIPARLQVKDVLLTLGFSLLLCLLAPLYPAWLASRVSPALALRHE
jgi:lipoprotein-releasing system permease protein